MADRFLVATANYNSTDAWSASSGGAAGASVPGTGDDVYLDANSGAVTLTVNVTSYCRDFVCTGFTGTLTGSYNLLVYGTTFTLGAGMTNTLAGYFTFKATSGTTAITCAGIRVNSVEFAGTGGTFQLQDAMDSYGANFVRTAGTFDANSQLVTLSYTSLQNIYGFSGTSSFYDLSRVPTSNGTNRRLSLLTDITVTNDLILSAGGTDVRYRLSVITDEIGTDRTLTVGNSITVSYTDFTDIAGAGAASWDISGATGGSGDRGGNSGITFTTAATSYAIGTGTRNFYQTNMWADATGGVAGTGRPPLPQDTSVLDANSGTDTIGQNMSNIGSVVCTGYTGTFLTNTTATVYGSITLASGMTLTASTNPYTFAGRGSHTITSAGKTWAKHFYFEAYGGTYSLLDDLTFSAANSTLYVNRGTFDANDQDVTCTGVNISATTTRTVKMGNGTWTLNAAGSVAVIWQTSSTTGLTLDAEGSTIVVEGAAVAARYFRPAGLTYNNLVNNTTGALGFILYESGTFASITVSPGATQKFWNGTTTTATTWVLEGDAVDGIILASDTTSAFTIAKAGGGTVVADYATISYCTASPVATFSATNSTDGGNNTNWTFVAGGFAGSVDGVETPAAANGVEGFLVINGVS